MLTNICNMPHKVVHKSVTEVNSAFKLNSNYVVDTITVEMKIPLKLNASTEHDNFVRFHLKEEILLT